MKNSHLFFVMILVIGIVACNNDNEPDNLMKAREVAWNSLEESSQETVIVDWRKAQVEIRNGQYLVLFNTEDDALLGPIGVLVNRESFEIEGQTPRY